MISRYLIPAVRISFLAFALWSIQIWSIAQPEHRNDWQNLPQKIRPATPGSGFQDNGQPLNKCARRGPDAHRDALSKVDSVRFKSSRLKATLVNLGCQMDFDVAFDESVENRPITVEMEKVTLRRVFEVILKMNSLSVKMKDEYTLFIFADTPENKDKYAEMEAWSEEPPRKIS